MKNIRKLSILFLVFFTQYINAQSRALELADRYFDRTFYSKAIMRYEQIPEKDITAEIARKLADSYYFTNNYEQAQKWYERVLILTNGQPGERYYFRYMHALKAAGDYGKAYEINRMALHSRQDSVSVRSLAVNIEHLDDISAIGHRFEISNLAFNTKHSEFGAISFGDNILFSGVRRNGKRYKWNDEPYLDILSIKAGELQAADSTAASFSSKINTKMHEGNAIITKDGKTLYFTRNYSEDGKRRYNSKNTSPLQLFRAEKIDSIWTNIISLPFNSSEYSTEHPALSADEQTLYFSSDRPGSYGSFDIYSVAILGEEYGTPQNLGPYINTAEREQFPFISKDNRLYFSSDGHFGYGALDVFVSDIKDGAYSKAVNIGLPVNSGYDDFSFNIDSDTKQGYFSSNRKDGKGSDDIYTHLEIKPLIIESCKQYITGIITDIDTGLPLQIALVILYDTENNELERISTPVDGSFTFTVKCSAGYIVMASKELYSTAQRSLILGKERHKHNDASMALKSDKVVKEQAEKEKEDAKKREIDDKDKRIAEVLSKEKDVVRDKDRLVIKTEPIYFDYDLWYIRKESKAILERVIFLMNKYPKMVVEIGSHTDVRGNNEYNRILSAKRAASTRDYFIEKGIPDSRIFSKGYGESIPIIRCVPDHSCNEEQHELNRRSEFVITDI